MPHGRHGRFLGLPYDWRRPTLARIRSRMWNPAEPKLLVPKAFGWGYDLNVAALVRRLTRGRRPRGGPPPGA
jgi:hypothetical protein